MTTDKGVVMDYIKSRKNILEYFQCKGDFFIKPLTDNDWQVKMIDDFYILSYWNSQGVKIDAVIVKKSGQPMIYRAGSHTMVVAIDCVKIGFVFDSHKELGQ